MIKFTIALFAVVLCAGCGPEPRPTKDPISVEGTTTVQSESANQFPRLDWSVPKDDASDIQVNTANKSVWPVSVAGMQDRFTQREWAKAEKPSFTVWRTDNDFLRITISPDSQLIGTWKATTKIDSGPMRGELISEIRTTEPLLNDDEALQLLEAYLKQDDTFPSLVQWSDDSKEQSN